MGVDLNKPYRCRNGWPAVIIEILPSGRLVGHVEKSPGGGYYPFSWGRDGFHIDADWECSVDLLNYEPERAHRDVTQMPRIIRAVNAIGGMINAAALGEGRRSDAQVAMIKALSDLLAPEPEDHA